MEQHIQYMERCLQLAALGGAEVAPNPMVGAVLVHNGNIIGEGFHQQFGAAHAEVNCIASVAAVHRHLIPDATLYVSLEPCNHFGKTPPCTSLVLQQDIKKVVIACRDPFDKVNGSGINKLLDAGVEVIEGVLKEKAEWLNRRFFTYHKRKRPYIILKWAQSSDFFIARRENRTKITSLVTDRLVHQWRSEESAIIIGSRTAIIDNPSLTTRLYPGKNPLRLVIDSNLSIPQSHLLLQDEFPLVIFNNKYSKLTDQKEYCKVGYGEHVLSDVLHFLYNRGIVSLIVEGGAATLQSFINANVWDEARVITNLNLFLGEGLPSPILAEYCYSKKQVSGSDCIDFYFNEQHKGILLHHT